MDTYLFLPLAVRLVNDPSSVCRQRVSTVIVRLLETISQHRRDALMEYVFIWLKSSDSRMRKVALQFYLLLAGIDKSKFTRRFFNPNSKSKSTQDQMYQYIFNIITLSSQSFDLSLTYTDQSKLSQETNQGELQTQLMNVGEQFENEIVDNDWGECYLCLKLVERVCSVSIQAFDWNQGLQQVQDVWCAIVRLVLHGHIWIREVTSNLVQKALISQNVCQGLVQFLHEDHICWFLIEGLRSRRASQSICQSLVQSLLQVFQYQLSSKNVGENKEVNQQYIFEDALLLVVKLADNRLVSYKLQRRFALKLLIAIVVKYKEQVGNYLVLIMRPFYRLTEGDSQDEEEVVLIGQEGLAQFREILGVDVVSNAFARARDEVLAVRKNRQKKKSLEAVVDPEGAAKKKQRINVRKKIAKYKRLAMTKELRMSGLGLGVSQRKRKKK
eukprot:TRINITY_DN8853_c0_g1_i5.p1 TRINITY_DN8853_c0_g1~~TRINITY_DN8853_c0_g1_i5.p1  ORF type:complete len:441 (-),score=46.31 TRINITY_DN8853_c0_g1_i5:208-1530(-)